MRASLSALLLGAALAMLAPSAGYAAAHAGRVLIAAGQVTIVRGTQRIAAQSGTPVEAGDTVELGPKSNAQLLLTDHSIIALRPQTTFRIDAYKFSGHSAPGEHAFLALLKGGMRTLTGIIGHVRHQEYHVTTPTATVGIRGTNYALVQCDNSCRNPDGTLAPNGTYGGVIGGRISVTNHSGVHVFGVDQFFRVTSQTAAPTQLIGPPPFLQDTLQGRGRVRGAVAQGGQGGTRAAGEQGEGEGGAGSQSAGTVAQTGLGGGTGDTRVTSTTTSPAPTLVETPTVYQVTTSPSVTTNVLSTFSGTIFYRLAGNVSIPLLTCSSAPCGTITAVGLTLAVDFTTNRAYLKANFVSLDQTGGSVNIFNTGTPFNSGGIPVTVSGGQATFSGTLNRIDYPTQQGAFRCLGCASSTTSTTPGYLDTISVSGTISGTTANLTLSGSSAGGGTGSFNATLTQAMPPNPYGAAMVIPADPVAGGPTVAFSSAYWGVGVGASQQLVAFGGLGEPAAAVGSATNTVVNSAPNYGNLVWGYWTGGGASAVPYDYSAYTTLSTGPSSYLPWITGDVTTTLPASLGTVTFTPIGGTTDPTAQLNSASLTADFVNRQVSVNINATNLTYNNNFVGSGTSGIGSTSGRFAAGFSTVTCTGPCGGTTQTTTSGAGSFAGFFAGPNAEGAGVAFVMGGVGAGQGVDGAIAFKR